MQCFVLQIVRFTSRYDPQAPAAARHSLSAHEFGEPAEINLVRGPQGIEIRRPDIVSRYAVHAAPREGRLLQNLFQQQVGDELGIAAVVVREWVDPHQPLVRPSGDLA
jgi:hypothetical protein